MKRLALAVSLTAAMLIASAVNPARAITYGEPDAGEHPYVGFMIFFVPSEPGWFSCSGTQLDGTTFLTAGHCTFDVGVNGKDGATPTGGNDVWVTFQETEVLKGWPARADYPDEASLYKARSSWLNKNRAFTRGVAIPDPRYDDFAEFPVNHDVGVVELSGAVKMKTYGVIAALGTVEQMVAQKSGGNNEALVENSGYGIQAIQPNPMDIESRYKSTSKIVETTGNASAGGNLHTLNNPSAIGGIGGTCFGDSGGPVFVNNTNRVVAVVSFGYSNACHGADYSWRVDTAVAYAFLSRYVSVG